MIRIIRMGSCTICGRPDIFCICGDNCWHPAPWLDCRLCDGAWLDEQPDGLDDTRLPMAVGR